MTRLFIGGGREIGLRPADIVGAIANETGLSGKAIGAIEIADRFALVEVPEQAADDVIGALNRASIRGRRIPVRRERDSGAT
jgi:ATP-dependent RNA helicase DeaD